MHTTPGRLTPQTQGVLEEEGVPGRALAMAMVSGDAQVSR